MNGTGPGLNTNSYISISLVVTIVAAAVWLNNSLTMLNYRMLKLEERQSRPDPWTGTDMFRWSIDLRDRNPTLKVPEPKHQVQP